MNRLLASLLFFLALLPAAGQDLRRFRVMEYNCENLFDSCHDAGKDDLQFLPEGEFCWTSGRYRKKLSDLARVILDAGGLQPVDLVGLCEVENDSVMRDLTRRSRLASLGYEYVLTEGPDPRGIDVALLYQPLTFRLLTSATHFVPYNAASERPTRPVLHCSGVIPTGDTLDVVVVHFPSRRGGVGLTKPYRLRAADVVRSVTDSLGRVRRRPAIVVMGDCNDEPSDASVKRMADGGFCNLSARAAALGDAASSRFIRGTYFFQHKWSRIDNVLLSCEAVRRFRADDCVIFAPDYLLETDSDGFFIPFRLYRGPQYHGGVSDHLPLLLDLWY